MFLLLITSLLFLVIFIEIVMAKLNYLPKRRDIVLEFTSKTPLQIYNGRLKQFYSLIQMWFGVLVKKDGSHSLGMYIKATANSFNNVFGLCIIIGILSLMLGYLGGDRISFGLIALNSNLDLQSKIILVISILGLTLVPYLFIKNFFSFTDTFSKSYDPFVRGWWVMPIISMLIGGVILYFISYNYMKFNNLLYTIDGLNIVGQVTFIGALVIFVISGLTRIIGYKAVIALLIITALIVGAYQFGGAQALAITFAGFIAAIRYSWACAVLITIISAVPILMGFEVDFFVTLISLVFTLPLIYFVTIWITWITSEYNISKTAGNYNGLNVPNIKGYDNFAMKKWHVSIEFLLSFFRVILLALIVPALMHLSNFAMLLVLPENYHQIMVIDWLDYISQFDKSSSIVIVVFSLFIIATFPALYIIIISVFAWFRSDAVLSFLGKRRLLVHLDTAKKLTRFHAIYLIFVSGLLPGIFWVTVISIALALPSTLFHGLFSFIIEIARFSGCLVHDQLFIPVLGLFENYCV